MSVQGGGAARAWLGALFFVVRRAPWLARLLRPLVVWGVWRFSTRVRENTWANARRVLGGGEGGAAERAARGVIGSFYDAVVEFGSSRGKGVGEFAARVGRVEGADAYAARRAAGKGAVIVTAHLGPFESAIASLRERERNVHVVFRRDEFAAFERLRSGQRARLGVQEAAIDEGLATWMTLREALLRDEVVLIQGDRVLTGQRGVKVRFLGGHVMLPDGPARLAMIAGSPLIPAFATKEADGSVTIRLHGAIEVGDGAGLVSVERAVEMVGGIIAETVRRYPDQWLMMEKAWSEDRGE